ncbi:uncharacterized protein HMPREF1541_02592 [Cyphellophora europaea CBS 101466]|uniref:Uncharacterized protein n=1 Tax=Cyphellophora europaea (strain CBS 101466) TaxID=1220924 RepID=W2S5Y4_CYPE1|nr:uncharacterized protein HMPREF1541_02592 [Cyphellophora europaea CBS 101466]ETN43433.1 hypothetical protein HMPREF1541_02592 [Cyphellophora europaea CBS 101466]
MPGDLLDVIGIGTVEIPTKRSPNLSGTAAHGSLILDNVLHVPNALCHGIGHPIFHQGYSVMTHFTDKFLGTIKDQNGKNVAFFDPNKRLFGIKLRETPRTFDLWGRQSCGWARVKKWLSLSATLARGGETENAEKAFLKKHYGSELKFLMTQGLSIYKDERREDGRQILRALMQDEDEDGEDDEEGSEFDFTGHQADYNFTHKQLDWIEKNYKNSENFMISYGLKFYDNDDLHEAKAIANAMMRDDDD